MVLPTGDVAEELRWIGTWPELGPIEAVSALGLSTRTEWKQVCDAVYNRFADHWAAGVAFHH